MRRDELVEMMSIWINTTTLSNEAKAVSCADVAEIYHTEQLKVLDVDNYVCVCDEETPANRINNKWICAKCHKPLLH